MTNMSNIKNEQEIDKLHKTAHQLYDFCIGLSAGQSVTVTKFGKCEIDLKISKDKDEEIDSYNLEIFKNGERISAGYDYLDNEIHTLLSKIEDGTAYLGGGILQKCGSMAELIPELLKE